jgi:hypothetical protein
MMRQAHRFDTGKTLIHLINYPCYNNLTITKSYITHHLLVNIVSICVAVCRNK